jgi:hypothetical protein
LFRAPELQLENLVLLVERQAHLHQLFHRGQDLLRHARLVGGGRDFGNAGRRRQAQARELIRHARDHVAVHPRMRAAQPHHETGHATRQRRNRDFHSRNFAHGSIL